MLPPYCSYWFRIDNKRMTEPWLTGLQESWKLNKDCKLIIFSTTKEIKFYLFRSPFKPLTRTSHVPWNEIHVLEPIIMSSSPRLGISWAEEDSSQGTSSNLKEIKLMDFLREFKRPSMHIYLDSSTIDGNLDFIHSQYSYVFFIFCYYTFLFNLGKHVNYC